MRTLQSLNSIDGPEPVSPELVQSESSDLPSLLVFNPEVMQQDMAQVLPDAFRAMFLNEGDKVEDDDRQGVSISRIDNETKFHLFDPDQPRRASIAWKLCVIISPTGRHCDSDRKCYSVTASCGFIGDVYG